MKLRIFAAAILLGLSCTAGAVRVLEQVERPFELTLSQLSLPEAATGSLSFKSCAECRTATHRVTATTTYVLNGRTVALEDLLRVTGEIKAVRGAAERTNATVFLDIATGRVTRVAVRRDER